MKYIKDLHEEGTPEPAGEPKSYWIIYKADDENRTKVDSFEGTDAEIEDYLKKKNAEGEDTFKAWTIDGLELGDESSNESVEYIQQKASGALAQIKIEKHDKSIILTQHKDQIVITPEKLSDVIEKLQSMQKYIQIFEGSSDREKRLLDIYKEIFFNAKKEYMNAIADVFDELGFKVHETNVGEDLESFSSDNFLVSYDKVRMKISFSNRGVSIRAFSKDPRMKNFDQGSYSVMVKTLLKKIINHLERNK